MAHIQDAKICAAAAGRGLVQLYVAAARRETAVKLSELWAQGECVVNVAVAESIHASCRAFIALRASAEGDGAHEVTDATQHALQHLMTTSKQYEQTVDMLGLKARTRPSTMEMSTAQSCQACAAEECTVVCVVEG